MTLVPVRRPLLGRSTDIPKFYESVPLPAPVTITEPGGPVDVVELTIVNSVIGKYRGSVGIIAQFTSNNDQLTFRLLGTFPSADFVIEAKDANERVPIYHEITVGIKGPFNIIIQCEIMGAGAADVNVNVADIFLQRIR